MTKPSDIKRAKTFSASTSYDDYKKNLASITEQEVPSPSPPMSPESEKSNIAFTKAAFAFRDRLDGIRTKRQSGVSAQQPLVAKDSASDPEKDDDGKDQHGAAQRIRILRGVQGLLTALLSLAIAVMQGRVYAIYQNTKNVTGAWPPKPNLMPTLLLFSVAIAALVFDVALIVGYTKKGRVGKVAYEIAVGAHYVAVTAKMASFALTSIVCRTGFNFGNDSGQHNDLWSWTCTDQAQQMSSVNQASTDCSTQTAAWAFALSNVAIEAIGIAINLYVKITGASDIVSSGDGGEAGGDDKGAADGGDEKSGESGASSPLLSRMSPKQRRSQLGSMFSDVSSHLTDVTPEIDDKPAEDFLVGKLGLSHG